MSTARPLVVETEPDVEVVIDDRDTSDTSAADRAAAERYLVERVLTLVGVGSESSDIRLGVVDEEGMVPITAGAGSTTAAVRLERLLFADAANRSEGIERGLVDLLEDGRDGLQRWIERGFFRVHARLSDGEPNVWHLSSASGAFQALVVANRFDTDHIRLLRSHDVRRTVLGLRRSLNDASDSNDRVTALTNQISEVRALDRGLAELEQRDWRPDQKGGLGTLRKLGLLASMEPPAPSSTV